MLIDFAQGNQFSSLSLLLLLLSLGLCVLGRWVASQAILRSFSHLLMWWPNAKKGKCEGEEERKEISPSFFSFSPTFAFPPPLQRRRSYAATATMKLRSSAREATQHPNSQTPNDKSECNNLKPENWFPCWFC